MIEIATLCLFAFFAGLIDAAVGGGGLIQIPALFNTLPNAVPASLLGTNKLASVCGTVFSARSYAGRVKVPWGLVLPAACTAFVMSFVGAASVSSVPQHWLRPAVLVLIGVMAIYTFMKKDFGAMAKPKTVSTRERVLAMLIGGAIGFYDGLFGPGTGSFLIFLFIRFFGFDFLLSSACAKFVNIATNVAALCFFIPAGKVLYGVALPMAACNIVGALTGTHLATRHGSGFVRKLFLGLLCALMAKLSYDLWVA